MDIAGLKLTQCPDLINTCSLEAHDISLYTGCSGAVFNLTLHCTPVILLAACVALLLASPIAPGGENVADAMNLIAAKDFDGARKILEAVVSSDETNAEACYQLGRLLSGHYRDFDAAKEVLEKALERADGDAGYHFLLGTVYGRLL